MNRKVSVTKLRRFIIEELESRRVMAGDVIASAEYTQLYADVPYTVAGTLGDEAQAAADVDMFRLTLQSGQQLAVEIIAPTSTLQAHLRLFNAQGNQLTANATNSFNGDPKLTFNIAASGDYFVGVSAFGNFAYDPNTLNNHVANASLGMYRLNLIAKSPVTDNSLATRYVVDTNADVVNPTDGHLSLREALSAANQASGKSIIEFSIPNQTPDFDLTQGPLVINSAVTLIGPPTGQRMRIRLAANAAASRLLTINSNADANIKNIVFDGGSNGGGDGGNLWVGGKLTLDSTEIIGGSAQRGGGVFVSSTGVTKLINTTVAQSSANQGGGIFVDFAAVLTAINSTVSTNTAVTSGNAIYNRGAVSLMNSTVTNNGTIGSTAGTISYGSRVTVRNSLVTGNASNDFVYSYESVASGVPTTIESQGSNLLSSSSYFAVNSSFPDSVESGQFLSALDYNGGFARTHLIRSGSRAIDAGNAFGVQETDQRGAPRVLDGVDFNNASDATPQLPSQIPNVADFVDQTLAGDGTVDVDSSAPGSQVTLRAAVQELNASTQLRIYPPCRFMFASKANC